MQLFWEIRNQEKSVSAQIWESTKIPVATIWRHSEGNVWGLNEFGFKFRSSLDFGVNLVFVYIPIYKAVYGGKNKRLVWYMWCINEGRQIPHDSHVGIASHSWSIVCISGSPFWLSALQFAITSRLLIWIQYSTSPLFLSKVQKNKDVYSDFDTDFVGSVFHPFFFSFLLCHSLHFLILLKLKTFPAAFLYSSTSSKLKPICLYSSHLKKKMTVWTSANSSQKRPLVVSQQPLSETFTWQIGTIEQSNIFWANFIHIRAIIVR